MNILMSCFMSYLIIVFSIHGHRDFYYYEFGAWVVFLLPRSLMRVASIFTFGDLPSTVLPTAIAGSLLLLSAQFVFVQFLGIERDETKESRAAAKNVQRLLGIREEAAPGTEMRKAIVRESAKAMQEQFMLSNRETEVLALYAMGLTQAKIAEELRIALGTAHTHVKRIYSKTDLHSRQAILDYIEQYAD
ncbi:MAG: helix-turn-helix transcriptional regulator [Slackia sp.]|uniref:helix-turn-helix transcriptional regulator n=1 Tax=uncultured Slackia sp. TaxID=665903 RepID=UPI0028042E94|nr:helix-turn-helix transcriptional regulator [uncultured Slackia sp.]MDU6011104.1 helix-turn-helix transcriptional regulator [Slackia sp.]